MDRQGADRVVRLASAPQAASPRVRHAELLASLSQASGLGAGQPMTHGLRACLVALRLAESLGLSSDERSDVYDVSLVRWIGCTSDTQELATVVDDDVAARAGFVLLDGTPPELIAFVAHHAGIGRGPLGRAGAIARAAAAARTRRKTIARSHSEAARLLTAGLGLGRGVQQSVDQLLERFDGSGLPLGLRGDDLTIAIRVARVGVDAEMFHRLGGWDAVVSVARRRRGTFYDPRVADALVALGEQALELPVDDLYEAVVAAEPRPRAPLEGEALDEALRTVGDFGDLKSRFFTSHGRRVGELAGEAAVRCGLGGADVLAARHAGYVHDLGRIAVPIGVLEHPGRLPGSEFERLRLHAYHTERALRHLGPLGEAVRLAGLHHERLNGSGYHRGSTARDLSPAARIVAAADVYVALASDRPHRPVLTPEAAADELRREARSGLLDTQAVDAVLGAAGHPSPRRARDWPGGLTSREVEVLQLVAAGHSNPTIAARLSLSRKTVSRHLEHIYPKIGVSTRAGATLFAMQHGLVAVTAEV
jgi:HD-GYP domain-containing protein (c-di-GMP phosphodiesterase class II)/DNA-binding CsgD family transcriptional regulator